MLIEQQPRPLCSKCNKSLVRKNGITKLGIQKWAKYCSYCHKAAYNQKHGTRYVGYRLHKKSLCERCGFIPEHPCQLDVDHIDGDRKNNHIDNLQTLCANCHRLKTWVK